MLEGESDNINIVLLTNISELGQSYVRELLFLRKTSKIFCSSILDSYTILNYNSEQRFKSRSIFLIEKCDTRTE
jgi:hypothetical protein